MLPVTANSVLLTLLSIASAVEASPWRASPLRSRTAYAVKDTHNVPPKWSRISSAPKDHVLQLQIALKQDKFDELERHLYEGKLICVSIISADLICRIVSDPSHARYGQHLTEAEVHELIKPSDDALTLVQDWLFSNHLNASQLGFSPAKDFISVTLPVEKVENLLDVSALPEFSSKINLCRQVTDTT